MTRRRLIPLVAMAAFGIAVAFAVADSVTHNGGGTGDSQGQASGYIEGAAGTPITGPESGERGAYASGLELRADKDRKADKRDRAVPAAATILADTGDDGDGATQGCADNGSCVGRLIQLVPRVRERVSDLLTIRDCKSSIGGEATCFDFGGGAYLVGDAPNDGQAELGFCTGSGYYYVSASPSVNGGEGGECPGDRADDGKTGTGDAPRARECKSSVGGEATCFYFGGGNYIVSDPFADGEGELGFCTTSTDAPAGPGYYYVSAPSAKGDAGAECPGPVAAA